MVDSDGDLDSRSVNELARQKIGETLVGQDLRRNGKNLRNELEEQRQNALLAVRQMEREVGEGRLVRSELEELRVANGELKALLAKAEKETENMAKQLCEARAQVVLSKEKTEKLLTDRSELATDIAHRMERVAEQSTQVSGALLWFCSMGRWSDFCQPYLVSAPFVLLLFCHIAKSRHEKEARENGEGHWRSSGSLSICLCAAPTVVFCCA